MSIEDLKLTPGNGEVEAKWTLTSKGGKGITAILTAGGVALEMQILPATATKTSFTGLANGTEYGVTVDYVTATASKTSTPVASTPPPTPTPPTPPTPASTKNMGGCAYLIGSSAATSDLSAEIDVLIVQSWRTDLLAAMRSLNQDAVVLAYQEFGATSVTSDGNCDSAVPYTQSQAGGWLLGSNLLLNGYTGQYAADIGSSGYQQAAAANMIALCKAKGFDGVFLDDVNSTITDVTETKYATTYGTEMADAIAVVGPTVIDAGYLCVANIGSWGNNVSWGNGLLASLSGGMEEMWLGYPETGGMGEQGTAVDEQMLSIAQTCAAAGKYFLAVCQAASSDTAAVEFCTAGLMLAATSVKQAIYYGDGQNYSQVTWPAAFTVAQALGAPEGLPTAVAATTLTRGFANGSVEVNLNAETGTITEA